MEWLAIFVVGVWIIGRLFGGGDGEESNSSSGGHEHGLPSDRAYRAPEDRSRRRPGEGYYTWLQRVKPENYNAIKIASEESYERKHGDH
jgi:hypothetical protein